MNKPLSLALFGVGVSGIVGSALSTPFGAEASPVFGDGTVIGKAVWVLIAGAVAAAVAQVSPVRRQRLILTSTSSSSC